MKPRSRHGMTIVEVLVCMGVLGLLMSLLLAATQSARATARKISCLDRIRQMGLACQAFEASHGSMPRTGNGFAGSHANVYFLSPHVHLLPYLDHQSLYDTIDHAESSPGQPGPPQSIENADVIGTAVALFACPDDNLAVGGATNYRACMGVGPGVHGGGGWDTGNGSGAWRHGRPVRSAEITDGLSNTILFSEKLTGDRDASVYTAWRDSVNTRVNFNDPAKARSVCEEARPESNGHESYGGAAWLFGGFRATWYNHILPPNSPTPDCGAVFGAYAARSFHRGGVNIALADGSSRFIADGVDAETWRSLATRHLGEVAAQF